MFPGLRSATLRRFGRLTVSTWKTLKPLPRRRLRKPALGLKGNRRIDPPYATVFTIRFLSRNPHSTGKHPVSRCSKAGGRVPAEVCPVYAIHLAHSRTAARPSLRRREASAPAARGRIELVPGGGLGAQQIAHEIIPAAAHHVGLIAETVIAVGQQQQIEILIRLD